MKLLLFGTCTILLSSTVPAFSWTEPSTFRELRLGEDLTTQVPHCRSVNYERTCWTLDNDTPPLKYEVQFGYKGTEQSIGPVKVGTYVAVQYEGKLQAVRFDFSAGDYETLVEIFKKRYGRPTRKAPTYIKSNHLAIPIKADVMEWIGKRLQISLWSRTSDVAKGTAEIVLKGWTSKEERIESEALKKAAGSL